MSTVKFPLCKSMKHFSMRKLLWKKPCIENQSMKEMSFCIAVWQWKVWWWNPLKCEIKRNIRISPKIILVKIPITEIFNLLTHQIKSSNTIWEIETTSNFTVRLSTFYVLTNARYRWAKISGKAAFCEVLIFPSIIKGIQRIYEIIVSSSM